MDYEELTEEQIEYTNYEEEMTRYILDEQQKQIEEIKKEQDKSKDYLFLYLLELIKDYDVSSEGLLELDNNIITDILNKVNKKIEKELSKEKKKETNMIDKLLNNTIVQGYYLNSFLTSLGNKDYVTTKISDNIKDKILNEKIDNKTYIERINKNKDTIYNNLKDTIKSFIEGTISFGILKKQINVNSDVNKFYTDRLTNDQTSRKYNQSKMQWLKDNKVKKKLLNCRFCNSCEDCKADHHRIFDMDDNTIVLPRHVRCMCFWSNISVYDWDYKGNISLKDFDKWLGDNIG